MAQLKMMKFKCITKADNQHLDSPYFVLFIGKGDNPNAAQLMSIRKDSWENDVKAGDERDVNVNVGAVDNNTLVLCALMEENGDPDIAYPARGFHHVESAMKTALHDHVSTGGGTSADQLETILTPEFRAAIGSYRGDDDLVNLIRVPTNIDGYYEIEKEDHGGHYRVWFHRTTN